MALAQRTTRLYRWARGSFDLAVAHGSNDLALAAARARIPAVNMFDYEFAIQQHNIGCRLARRVITPDAIPPSRLARFGPRTRGDGFGSGVLVGGALGFVYTPCASPILAAVISVGAASGRTIAIAIAYAGGWLWTLLVTLATIGLYVEWLMIVGASGVRTVSLGVALLAISGLCLVFGRIDAAFGTLSFGMLAVAGLSSGDKLWIAGGLLYAGAAQVASVLVRADPVSGLAALMLILLTVWATDIAAYFAGRRLGGPKLWPRVSPKKTWAGAIGGFAASLAVAAGFVVAGQGKTGPLLMAGAGLSIVSQLGDLFESAVKRRFGVKDSSHLIPGHGGLLDRLDGLVAAVVAAAIFGSLRAGVDSVGRGLMIW